MLKQLLAALFGSFLFCLLVPILYWLFLGLPQSFAGVIGLAVVGAVLGAALGTMFPRTFGFVFELLMNI